MVEKSWPSTRESFEIEAPRALDIEDPSVRSSNASIRTDRNVLVRFLLVFVAVVVVGVTAACVCFSSKSVATPTITPLAIDGSLLDEGISYGSLKFSRNGMRVVLGEAMKTKVASVSFCLGIGCFSEPKELAGVMVLLATALLKGSQKYPQGNKWTDYLYDHPVVEVEQTQTCYGFQVKNASLDAVLDRFVDALKNPLFQKRTLQRITENFNDPSIRKSMKMRFLDDMNPDHPAHDPYSLVDDLKAGDAQSKVFSFFKQYFNAQDMTLTVIAPQTLADLVPLMSRFEMLPGTPDRGPTARGPQYGGKQVSPFLPGHFAGLLYRAAPGPRKTMGLSWLLSNFLRNRWREKPYFYALDILNWASEGSLKHFFIEKRWIKRKFVAKQTDEGTYSTFDIFMDLTPEGHNHIVEIGTIIFEYLRFLSTVRRDALLDWLKNAQRLQDFRFKHSNRYDWYYSQHPSSMYFERAEAISKGLLSYPEQYVVSAPQLLFKTDPDAQLHLLSELTVDSVRVTVTAEEYNDRCKQMENISGTSEYVKTQLTQEMVNAWKAAESSEQHAEWMHLSPTNPFLPVNVNLVPSSPEAERYISMQLLPPKNMVRVFSLTNTKYRIPKVISYIRIFSDVFVTMKDAADSVARRMRLLTWGRSLKLTVQKNLSALEQIYRWSVLDVRIDLLAGCLEIQVEILGNLMPTVIRNVAQHIVSLRELPADNTLFRTAYNSVEQVENLRPILSGVPMLHGLRRYIQLVFCDATTHEQRLSALGDLKEKGLKGEPEWLLKKAAIEMLVVGNVLPQQAERWSRNLAQELRLEGTADLLKQARQSLISCQFPKGTSLWRMPGPASSTENAVMLFFQFQEGGDDERDDENDAGLNLWKYILQNYLTHTWPERLFRPGTLMINDYGVHTFVLGAHSEFKPEDVQLIIHNSMGNFSKWVMRLDEDKFSNLRNSFVEHLSTSDSIDDLSLPIVKDFRSRRFTFDYMRRTKKILSDFSSLKFRTFLERHADPRKLYMQLTRTDGRENEILDAEFRSFALPDGFVGDLAFDQIWEGTEIPNSLKHVAVQGHHPDLTESVPAVIPAPGFS